MKYEVLTIIIFIMNSIANLSEQLLFFFFFLFNEQEDSNVKVKFIYVSLVIL